MFQKHGRAEFAAAHNNFPAATAHLHLCASTMLETENGFRPAYALRHNQHVACVGGGFAKIRRTHREVSETSLWHIPAGLLGACSDLYLPTRSFLALHRPAGFEQCEAPYPAMSVDALAGCAGITRLGTVPVQIITLQFDEEEIVYANTGALLLAHSSRAPHFPRLNHSETHALLALYEAGTAQQQAA